MAKIRSLTEVVISVHDMEKSLNFYRDILGLTVMSPPDFRGAVFLRVSEQPDTVPQQLVLVPLPEGTDAFPTERVRRPLHHLGLEIAREDFESERERLQGLGFDVRFGEHPFLALKGMYLDDPDGNEVELISMRA
jgi:catechol 2,3-dioxygenase-like lactoylglutathione lyase family enzyme